MAASDCPSLRLVRERKLIDLIPPPRQSAVLEASGVVAHGSALYVVFDNIRRVARVRPDLTGSERARAWVSRLRPGEGYEDIAYSPHRRRYYLLIEAEKHADGTFKPIIEEYDGSWRFTERAWVNVEFEKRNRGLEGLTAVRRDQTDFLLALAEGNNGLGGRRGRVPGGGRIHVLQKRRREWQSVALIELPPHLDFKDFSALSLRGDRLAVVSQKSCRLWIGRMRLDDWTVAGKGRVYDLPRTAMGKRLYCTVEGLDWLTDDTLVMVSDLRKQGYPERCAAKDQSVHVFRIPQ